MNAIITKTSSRDRYCPGKSVAYVECNLTKLIDKEFFDKHKIYSLNFKCKTWQQLGRLVNKKVISKIQNLFGTDEIKYSAKAGCNCGCSPGYKITHAAQYVNGQTFWLDVNHSDEELEEMRSTLALYHAKLQLEIANNTEVI